MILIIMLIIVEALIIFCIVIETKIYNGIDRELGILRERLRRLEEDDDNSRPREDNDVQFQEDDGHGDNA